jgi:hypothetical protein
MKPQPVKNLIFTQYIAHTPNIMLNQLTNLFECNEEHFASSNYEIPIFTAIQHGLGKDV